MKKSDSPEQKREFNSPLSGPPGGKDSKLERAFRALVGTRKPQDYRLAQFKAALRELGFSWQEGKASHPVAVGRLAALPSSINGEPLDEAFAFIARFFPETDFYLPYITAKARLLARLKAGGRLEPEPEYDEDGFLS